MGFFLGFLFACIASVALAIFCFRIGVGILGFIMGFILLVCAGIFGFIAYIGIPTKQSIAEEKAEKKNRKKKEELGRPEGGAAFYLECKKQGVHSCENSRNIQKATLIAKKMNIPFKDINALFVSSKRSAEELDRQSTAYNREQNLEIIRAKESQERASLVRYAKFTGRDKRLAMLTDEYSKFVKAAKSSEELADYLIKGQPEVKSDWAIKGGVASAIAGTGVGLAVAANDQIITAQKNAEIRAENEQQRRDFAPVIISNMQSSSSSRRRAEDIAKKMEEAKLKLVSESTPQECFTRLSFSDTTLTVSETGTCIVQTTASCRPFKIFDDVPAVVDGTIIAEIFDGKKQIGKAELVLPKMGVGRSTKLKGFALFCGEAGKEYTVNLTPNNLFEIEK